MNHQMNQTEYVKGNLSRNSNDYMAYFCEVFHPKKKVMYAKTHRNTNVNKHKVMIQQFLGICKVLRRWFILLIYFVGVKLAFGWWKIGTFKNINSRAFIATTFLLIYAQKMLWLTTSWVIYSTNKFDQLATTSSMIWWMRINKNVSIFLHKLIYFISFMNFCCRLHTISRYQ